MASQIWFTMRADAIFQSYEIRERQAKLAGDDAPPIKDPTVDDDSKETPEPSQGNEEEEEEENEYEEKVIVDPETADWNAYYEQVMRQIRKDEEGEGEESREHFALME